MIHDGKVIGLPLVDYTDTKASIEALSGLEAGMTAYASDSQQFGYYDGSAWQWLDTSLPADIPLEDTGGDHDLLLSCDEDLSADHTLGITVSDADRELALHADLTVSAACTLDQDLQQSASPTFDGLHLSDVGSYDPGRDITDLYHLVDKKYVDEAVTSLGARYYMTDTDSGISGYKLTQMEAPSGSEASLSFNNVTDDQFLAGWIAPSAGEPPVLIAGIYDWQITVEKTGGTKTLRLYWELVERESGGNETVIATSSLTDEIGAKDVYHAPVVLSSDYDIADTSYVVGKIYAEVTGSGNAPSVTIYYMGATASHWEIPVNTEILDGMYVNRGGDTMTGELSVPDLTVSNLAANRLAATDGTKGLASVADLTDWVAGTANRVSVTDDGDGTITLSTPQDIHTGASPTFADITLGAGSIDPTELSPVLAGNVFTVDDLLLLGPGCPIGATFWRSLRGQEATISGAFHLAAGRWAGTRALMVEEAATNIVTNPVAAKSRNGYDSAWGDIIVRSTEKSLFGPASVKWTWDGVGGGGCKYNLAGYSANTDYVASVYVWIPDIQTGDVKFTIFGDGWVSLGKTLITDRNRWVRAVVTFNTGTNSVVRPTVYINSPSASLFFYVDGLNVVAGSIATSHIDGDLGPGYSWSGTPHASESTRAATEVNLDDYADLISENDTWSLSLWWQPQYDADDDWPDAAYLFDTRGASDNHRVILEFDDDDDKYNVYVNGAWRFQSSAQTFQAGEWQHVVLTFDFGNDEYTLSVNGVQDGTDTTSLTAPTLTEMNLGSDYAGNNHANAAYAEFALFDRVLTSQEIAALYLRNEPLNDPGAIIAPVDNLGPSAGRWTIGISAGSTNSTTYVEVAPNGTGRFGFGQWVSGIMQFEVVMSPSNSAQTAYARLAWNDSGTWREVPNSEVSLTGTTTGTIVRSGPIFLSPGEREYRIEARSSDASAYARVNAAALVLTQGGLDEI